MESLLNMDEMGSIYAVYVCRILFAKEKHIAATMIKCIMGHYGA